MDDAAIPLEYLYVVERGSDGTYWVYFPDLPGCTSSSDTLEDLHRSATEALELYLSYYRERGEAPPQPNHIRSGTATAA